MKNESFKNYVLDQLRPLGGLECRAMFGGHGLYLSETIFGIIFKGRLFFKTTAVTRPLYESHGMEPFRPKANQTLGSYYEVPAGVIDNSRELIAWARQVIGEDDAD